MEFEDLGLVVAYLQLIVVIFERIYVLLLLILGQWIHLFDMSIIDTLEVLFPHFLFLLDALVIL
jgi:hypothetical protein